MSQNLNFANQDLRDRSFKGKNLVGADFSGADIRGCNFSRAQLKFASFDNVLAGKSQRQTAISSVISFAMALMVASTAMIAIILLVTFAITLITTFIFGVAIVNREIVYWVAIMAIVVFAVSFAIAFTISFTGTKGIFAAIPICLITAFASGLWGSTFTKILVIGAFNAIARLLRFNSFVALLIFLAIEPLQIFGSLYLFKLLINISRTTTGTKFEYADLTKASFDQATLVNCDFSHAVMDDVSLQPSQILRSKL